MSTLLKAMLVAGIGMALNVSGANLSLAQSKDTQSSVTTPESAANATGSQQDTGPQRRNRDSTQQQGGVTPGPGAGTHSNDFEQAAGAPTVHSDEQSANLPANPGDQTDELRNRDSRKQQGNASRNLPEPTQKQN